jgi:hypothetical protein
MIGYAFDAYAFACLFFENSAKSFVFLSAEVIHIRTLVPQSSVVTPCSSPLPMSGSSNTPIASAHAPLRPSVDILVDMHRIVRVCAPLFGVDWYQDTPSQQAIDDAFFGTQETVVSLHTVRTRVLW